MFLAPTEGRRRICWLVELCSWRAFARELLQIQGARLGLIQGQQQIQTNQIKLAVERFGMVNNAASGVLSDPDLGKTYLDG